MSEKKGNIKDIYAVIAIVATVAWYGIERIASIFINFDRVGALVFAALSVVMLAVVFFLIDSCTNSFNGMLASLVAFKMMPPSIDGLAKQSYDAAFLYYLVQKAAVLLFIYLFIKHYRKEKVTKISPFAVFILAFSVPFLLEISDNVGAYLMRSFGENMLFSYFSDFVFYSAAIFVAWLIALKSNYEALGFITCYELIALSINFLRKACYAVVLTIRHEHISLSIYCWMFIFAVGIVLFSFTYKQRKKNALVVG